VARSPTASMEEPVACEAAFSAASLAAIVCPGCATAPTPAPAAGGTELQLGCGQPKIFKSLRARQRKEKKSV